MYLCCFSDEPDNDHWDVLLAVEEKERLSIFDGVCSEAQPFLQIFHLHCSAVVCVCYSISHLIYIVTWRLKAGIWPSVGLRFAELIPVATRNKSLLDNGFWWARITVATNKNSSSVCSVCGPRRLIKGHVIHSQSVVLESESYWRVSRTGEWVVLSSRRLETRDQSENQKKCSRNSLSRRSSMYEVL
jgi:hypothetical protein